MSHVFLSYRSIEADFALKLAVDLKNMGVDLWMDRFELKAGQDWRAEIAKSLDACVGMIAVLSPDYLSSEVCMDELSRAKRLGKRIYPIVLHELQPDQWPFQIERVQGIICFDTARNLDWKNETFYNNHIFQSLLGAIQEQFRPAIGPVPDQEQQYLNELIGQLRKRKGVLEYVELSAKTNIKRSIDIDLFEDDGWDPSYRELSQMVESDVSQVDLVTFNDIRKTIERHRRFVLIGEPGAGKTTTIRRLALEAAQKRKDEPRTFPLPLLLSLPQWTEELSIQDFIRKNWPLPSDIIALLVSGEVLLYLDGLNEMGAAGVHKAKLLRQWLHDSAEAPRNIIITCRVGDYTSKFDLALPTVLAESMDEPQIRQFAHNYLHAKADSFLARVIPSGKNTDARALFRLARNPYMLGALTYLYEKSPDGELPSNTGALFQALVRRLWERERQRQTLGWIDFKDMEEKFGRLAFNMIETNLSVASSLQEVKDYLGDDFLLQIGQSANLIEIQDNKLRFYHQLMQEYFAAVGLGILGIQKRVKPPEFDRSTLEPKRKAGKWDQVVIAYCGIMNDPDSVVRFLNKIDPWLGAACIGSGANISENVIRENVTALLETIDKDFSLTGVTVSALEQIDDSAILPCLLDTLGDENANLRWIAASVLGNLKNPLAVPRLLEVVRYDADTGVKRISIEALGQIGDRRALLPLLDLLKQLDNVILQTVIWSLGRLRESAITPNLLNFLKHPNWNVAEITAWALGEFKSREALPFLHDALKHTNMNVRLATVVALGKIRAPESIKFIKEIAQHDSETLVRQAATIALGNTKDKQVLPIIEKLMNDGDYDVRRAAIFAYTSIRGNLAIPSLSILLNDNSLGMAAAESIGLVGDSEAVAVLKRWTENEATDGQRILQVSRLLPRNISAIFVPRLIKQLFLIPYVADSVNQVQLELERIGTAEAIAAVERWKPKQIET